jgi:hypothetical protein
MYVRRNTTVTPGLRVTVEIQHSDRTVLRPLIGKLRTIEVTADGRAVIYEADGRRYAFNGRPIGPVALIEVSIYTEPTTGRWWADVYELPPREDTPFPVPIQLAAAAERSAEGSIARLASCVCGGACRCPGCGQQVVRVPHGLEWVELLLNGEPHRSAPGCHGPGCVRAEPGERLPDCCGLPMMFAPVGWVCRRDSDHRRSFRW